MVEISKKKINVKAIMLLIGIVSLIVSSLSWGTLNDTVQVYIPKVTLIEDPHNIASETSWDQMNQEEQTCNLTINNEPPGDENLVVLETTDEGILTKEIDTKWIYTPLEESTTEKHPADFTTITVAAKIEDYEYTTTYFFVHSIFYYLAHLPDHIDRERAWQYAKWKYGINTSALNSISYNPSQSTPGLTGTYTNNCTLGTGAFGSENYCASVLGHENVHGEQPWWDIVASEASWLAGGPHYIEVDAYNWEINNASRTGLSSYELAEAIAWRDYYNRQGPHP